MRLKKRSYSGTKEPVITDRERTCREIVRKAAGEGIVMLKNEGLLPISINDTVALYGCGAVHAIKGGTGSGDVDSWDEVSIYQGLSAAGVSVLNEGAVVDAVKRYNDARLEWRDRLIRMHEETGTPFVAVYHENLFQPPEGIPVDKKEAGQADAVIYVISRVSGEGLDRQNIKGDYQLSETEESELRMLAECNDNIIVLINAGGQIDMKVMLSIPSVKAVLNISQGGMELGHAAADVLTGRVSPCGKLTQTWAYEYTDFPGSGDFGAENREKVDITYEEGIYVGYRYFDSFGIKPLYPFGYGLSYTEFSLSDASVSADDHSINVEIKVTNTGSTYAGREVVQIYAACPQKEQKKEFKRLIGFGKTRPLEPGESQNLKITMPVNSIASYRSDINAFVAEKGKYAIFAGTSSSDISVIGVLSSEKTVTLESVSDIMQPDDGFNEIERPDTVIEELTKKWKAEAAAEWMPVIPFAPAAEIKSLIPEDPDAQAASEIAGKMNDEELSVFLLGEISKGQDNLKRNELVATGIYIPGSAGESSGLLEEKYGVPGIPMVDGPAGLRLLQTYQVDKKTGLIYGESLDMALVESGLFCGNIDNPDSETYYQFTTAFPVGTLLAQTFDTELLEQIGNILGDEMSQFHASWLLGPGMNIQRNPLCGRNYEYYSEDPLVSGAMGAAITRGVQSVPGVGTVIKHLACNNKEDNRFASNSILSVRALREIYLRGFEIAVKTSQPMCIMMSYNMVNGVKSANSRDLCTVIARGEWDFRGIFMTDWTSTVEGKAIPHLCAEAGVDLIMPGSQFDIDDIKASLKEGILSRETARGCAARLIALGFKTNRMEGAGAYRDRFCLKPYLEVKGE